MTKRQRFIFSSVLLSSAFFFTASIDTINRLLGITFISFTSILLFLWGLSESIKKNATLLVLLLPSLFTFGIGSFWFLLPSVPWARLPILALYTLGMYALFLTSNIYTVSTIRSIALLRAAKSVGFVISLFTSFLLFEAMFSLKAGVFINIILSFVITFLLCLPNLWASELTQKISQKVMLITSTYSIMMSMFVFFLYFWPGSFITHSIFLTGVVYFGVGLGSAYLEDRLFRNTVREFLFLGIAIFFALFFSTSWRG